MQIDSGESYCIRPRTMKIREDKLVVHVESGGFYIIEASHS